MGRIQTVIVNLRRNFIDLAWGIGLVGGSDVGTPLIITKVTPGSPADGVVFRGDVIVKIDDYDSRDIRHVDAENLFHHAGENIRLVVERDSTLARSNPPTKPASNQSPATISYQSPPMSPTGRPIQSPPPTASYLETLQRPIDNLPHTIFPLPQDNVPDVPDPNQFVNREREQELEAVLHQPYRTTPLVLPGAKAKHEPVHCESYLRHHPNPMMRQSPHSFDVDSHMKQRQQADDGSEGKSWKMKALTDAYWTEVEDLAKEPTASDKNDKNVAENMLHRVVGDDGYVNGRHFVHKQFNSPIGLYSEPNVVNTIRQQTGSATPGKRPVFDPNRSETLKLLLEEHMADAAPHDEVSAPAPSRIFNPHQHRPQTIIHKKSIPTVQINNAPQTNPMGESLDVIHQSGSFRRLMNSVLN